MNYYYFIIFLYFFKSDVRFVSLVPPRSSVPKLLVDLHVKLLRKIGKSVSADRWEKYLVKACFPTHSNKQPSCLINSDRDLFFYRLRSLQLCLLNRSCILHGVNANSVHLHVAFPCRFAKSSTQHGRGNSSRKDTRRCRQSARRPYLK